MTVETLMEHMASNVKLSIVRTDGETLATYDGKNSIDEKFNEVEVADFDIYTDEVVAWIWWDEEDDDDDLSE